MKTMIRTSGVKLPAQSRVSLARQANVSQAFGVKANTSKALRASTLSYRQQVCVTCADGGSEARTLTKDEANRLEAGIGSIGLSREGPGGGGQWISTTTRHVHIFAGEIVNGDLDQSQLDKLTIDVDPDCEFIWNDAALEKVYRKFDSLVEVYAGQPLKDYTLRLMGSDLEHFIRKLLQSGEISYNLEHRALNYSMGRPRLALDNVPEEN